MVHRVGGYALRGRPSLVVVATLGVPLWLAGCDGASVDDAGAGRNSAGTDASSAAGATHGAGAGSTAGGSNGSAGRGRAGSSSATGGAGAGVGGDMSTVSGGAGTGAEAGTGTASGGAAGRGATGGQAGAGGGSSVGGRGPTPGYACGEDSCAVGQTCVSCAVGVTPTYEWRCTPDEDDDPDGYAQAIKDCQMVTAKTTCDGPEDCVNGEHCVYTSTSRGQPVCQAEPEVGPSANCCFTCDAVPVCTLCWTDYDCPETFICVHNPGQTAEGPGGCRLAE